MNRAQRKRARLTDKIISTTYHAVLQVLQALDLEEPGPFPLLVIGFLMTPETIRSLLKLTMECLALPIVSSVITISRTGTTFDE